jgi:UDP-N-acetylmuramoylalanine--D-glutamate ligase
VAVTSLHPDHLTWHGNAETYYTDKLSLCTQPGAWLTIANGDDPLLRARRHLLGHEVEWVGAPERPPGWTARLGLPGQHNLQNALIAQRCLVALGVPGADDPDLLSAAAEAADFAGLESRLQAIGRVNGVRFVDDSLSTNVLSTTAALSAFAQEPVAVIVGGFDRGIDYRPFAELVARRGAPLIVLALTAPDNGERILAALDAVELPPGVEVQGCGDLDEAVAAGFAWCSGNGVVLLSPAAASFGRFRDYRDRADAFRKAMHGCGPVAGER